MIAWLLVPICAWLWRKGGKENKDWRRYGIPLVIACVLVIERGFSPYWIVLAVAWHFVLRLPFTLIGDGINENPLNWAWIPVWALSHAGLVLFVNPGIWWVWVISSLISTTCAVLSNLKETRDTVTWPRCELVFGALVGFVAAAAI